MNIASFTLLLICAAFSKDLKAGVGKQGTKILSSTFQPFPYKKNSFKLDRSEVTLYRKDGRCGGEFPTEEGIPSQCDPEAQGNERGPCCSNAAWCGNSDAHCNCEGCIDYRLQITDHRGTKKITTTTATPFKQLADLLAVVSGNNLQDYRDNKYDSDSFQPTLTTKSPPPLKSSGQLNQKEPTIFSPPQSAAICPPCPCMGPQMEGRGRRMIAGLLAQGAPFLTHFAGGLIKMVLNQVINRPGSLGYTDKLVGRFVPRALSQTHLKNSQVSTSIQNQMKNHNFQSAIQTLTSASRPLEAQNYIPTRFKEVFNANTQDNKLVLATRKILTAITSTLDSIISQRLATVTNLLTSLITTVIESLRLLLQSLHEKHTQDDKKLLEITGKTLLEIQLCKPQDFGGLYASLAAVLSLLCLLFPTLLILKSSICNHANKLQHTQMAYTLRKAARSDLTIPLDSGITTSKSRSKTAKSRRKYDSSDEEGGFVKPISPKVQFSKELDEDKLLISCPTSILRKKE